MKNFRTKEEKPVVTVVKEDRVGFIKSELDNFYQNGQQLQNCCGVTEIGNFNFVDNRDIEQVTEDINDSKDDAYNKRRYNISRKIIQAEVKTILKEMVLDFFKNEKYPVIMTVNNRDQPLMLTIFRSVSRQLPRTFTFKQCISGSTKNKLTLITFIPNESIKPRK